MSDFTPHQQKIVKRYYDNLDTIKLQRLAELVGEMYLSTGKKLQKAWKDAGACMLQLQVPQSRVDHLLRQGKPELIAELVKELERKK
jgi:hypothetical protein